MRVSIRRTTKLDVIKELDIEVFGKDSTENKCSGKYEDDRTLWWVMHVDGQLAGFAGLRLSKEDGAAFGYLTRAGIRKKFRGKGLQKALIRVRDREAKKRGLVGNITYTELYNCPSANNLIKCGYALYNPEYRYGFKSALYFRKDF